MYFLRILVTENEMNETDNILWPDLVRPGYLEWEVIVSLVPNQRRFMYSLICM